MTYDIVIGVVPIVRLIPQIGPASLKASVEKAGFRCKVIDWNFDLWEDPSFDCSHFWEGGFDLHDKSQNTIKIIEKATDKWVEELSQIETTWIGLSIFGYRRNFSFADSLCQKIKTKLPHLKIILGGHGIEVNHFGKKLKSQKLIDEYISGEAEESLVHFLKYNEVPEKTAIKNLEVLQWPDYSDLEVSKYPDSSLYFYFSRGCIFKCDFCERFSEKYRYRQGTTVANEIISLNNKYGITTFKSADALVNGNLKELDNFCKQIIDNKLKISWEGSAVVRDMQLNLYESMKKSGCRTLAVGVESGSERVRRNMNKPVSNYSLYNMVENLRRTNIELSVNVLVGHYTETEKDFQETLDFITYLSTMGEWKPFISLGTTLTIDPNTNLYMNGDSLGIKGKGLLWTYKDNTPKVRFQRWYRLKNHCLKVGFDEKHLITANRVVMDRSCKTLGIDIGEIDVR